MATTKARTARLAETERGEGAPRVTAGVRGAARLEMKHDHDQSRQAAV